MPSGKAVVLLVPSAFRRYQTCHGFAVEGRTFYEWLSWPNGVRLLDIAKVSFWLGKNQTVFLTRAFQRNILRLWDFEKNRIDFVLLNFSLHLNTRAKRLTVSCIALGKLLALCHTLRTVDLMLMPLWKPERKRDRKQWNSVEVWRQS